MTLKELIEYSDGLTPNPFSFEVKTEMVNQIEAEVLRDVFLVSLEDVVQYSWQKDQQTELILKPPYTDVYKNYMKAMLYREMGESNRYNNENELFNESMRNLCRYVAETARPGDGRAMAREYYLSAYAIAVKHGFEGSEEEWLASLHGRDALVDESLMRKGAAADAKETGDRFRKLTDGSGEIDVHNIAARNVMSLGNEVDGFYLYASGREDGMPVTELGGLDDDSMVRLRGVAMPKNSSDASPKGYVDKLFAAAGKDGARIFRQAQEPLEAVDGDWWLDTSEDGGEDDGGCISDEELSKRIEDAVKAAFDKIPYAEEVAY